MLITSLTACKNKEEQKSEKLDYTPQGMEL